MNEVWFEAKNSDVTVNDVRHRVFVVPEGESSQLIQSLVGDYHEASMYVLNEFVDIESDDGMYEVRARLSNVFAIGPDPDLENEEDEDEEYSGPRI